MTLYTISVGAEFGAWVAAAAGVYALGKQVYDAFKRKASDREKLNKALDLNPEVRQQMELGNVGDALSHLNSIISTVSEENKRLRAHLQSAEAEADGWEYKFNECEELRRRQNDAHYIELSRLRSQADADRINFAQALAEAKEGTTKEGGQT